MKTTLKRTAVAVTVVGVAGLAGIFGGTEAVHAIGANHEVGWRVAEYIGGGWAGGVIASRIASKVMKPYVKRGLKSSFGL